MTGHIGDRPTLRRSGTLPGGRGPARAAGPEAAPAERQTRRRNRAPRMSPDAAPARTVLMRLEAGGGFCPAPRCRPARRWRTGRDSELAVAATRGRGQAKYREPPRREGRLALHSVRGQAHRPRRTARAGAAKSSCRYRPKDAKAEGSDPCQRKAAARLAGPDWSRAGPARRLRDRRREGGNSRVIRARPECADLRARVL